MIESYWNEVFGKYKTPSGKFEIPNFPEPLMSKHFGVNNIVGSEVQGYKKFWLCEFEPFAGVEPKLNVQTLDKLDVDFYKFHNLPFLEKLIPFLQKTEAPHYHFYLEDDLGIYVSALAGESSSGVFLFNLLVREDKRKNGVAKRVLKDVRSFFQTKPCFYWTIHEGFSFGAHTKEYYVKL